MSACATTAGQTGLMGKEWVVEDIAGRGVIDGSRLSLTFSSDGQLSGNTSCNRMFGPYSLSGPKLTISNAGLTKMACAPALMDQEHRFVDVLNAVQSYRIDPTGALVLTSQTGSALTAR